MRTPVTLPLLPAGNLVMVNLLRYQSALVKLIFALMRFFNVLQIPHILLVQQRYEHFELLL
jgi:hypothetical protein